MMILMLRKFQIWILLIFQFKTLLINEFYFQFSGRSFCITSQRTLMASLEQLIQKIHSGVVINFEKIGPDPPVIIPNEEEQPNGNEIVIDSQDSNSNSGNINGFINGVTNGNGNNLYNNNINNHNEFNGMAKNAWQSTRKLIYVQRSAQKGYSVGHWPIPESFWPDLSCPSLPPRTAHPVIKFTCTNSDPAVIDNLPFDKYELEPSPLTHFILSRKQPHVAWQCFVSNSHKAYENGLPFGYLKASTSLTCVNLFVLPYNYPILLPLLDDLFKAHQGKPSREWKIQFDNYLKNMPLYYASPLKRALQRMGASPNLVPDNLENCLSYPVLNYLKRLKNTAKTEYDKIVASVGTVKPNIPEGTRVLNNATNTRKLNEFGPVNSSHSYFSQRFVHLKSEFNEFPGFVIRFRDKPGYESRTQCYRNAFDISRHELLDQIARMRSNFLQQYTSSIKYQDDDQLHSLPISQMGNYQEYLKRMPMPLRELESTPVRQHMFGNPFKVDKRGMMIDEADIDLVGGSGSSPVRVGNKRSASESNLSVGNKLKRRPGPLPKDYPSQRPFTSSPPPSPLSPLSPSPLSPVSSPLIPPSSSQILLRDNQKQSISLKKDLPIVNNILNDSGDNTKVSNVLDSNSPLINDIKDLSNQKLIGKAMKYDGGDYIEDEIRSKPLEELEDFTMNFTINDPNQKLIPIFTPINGRGVNQNSSESISDHQKLISSNQNSFSHNLNHIDHNGIDNSTVNNNNNNNNNNNKRLNLTVEELEFKLYLFKLVRRPGKSKKITLSI